MLDLGRLLARVAAWASGLAAFLFTMSLILHPSGPAPGRPAPIVPWCLSTLATAVCIYAYRHLGRLARTRDAQTLGDARRTSSLEAHAKPLVMALSILVGPALLAGGIVLAAGRDGSWIGYGLMGLGLLLALLAASAVQLVLRPGPMLSMDARGIDHALYGRIPWSDIVGIQLLQVRTRRYRTSILLLGVRRPDRYLAGAPMLARWTRRAMLRDRPAYGTLSIPLKALDQHPDVVDATARALHDKAGVPRVAAWYPDMTPEHIQAVLDMESLGADMERLPAQPAPADMEAIYERMHTVVPAFTRAKAAEVAWLRSARRGMLWRMALVLAVLVALIVLRFSR